MAGGHLDRRTVRRKGYFQKKETGMPHPNYRTSCASGYVNRFRWDAHHIIPQTSIESSVGEFSGDKNQYIKDVQYMTDWVINNPGNMVGMPEFMAFLVYYERQEGRVDDGNPRLGTAGEAARVAGYISKFNKAKKSKRVGWLAEVAAGNPEGYPVHRPVSWGHVIYNDEVQADLKTTVWNPLNERKKKHATDAATVAGALNTMSTQLRAKLRRRGGGTTLAKWRRRNDPNDRTWYRSFTMANVSGNPIFA